MRRLLVAALACLSAAAPAVAVEPTNWHGIWMNGYNVVWIATGPGESVQVAAAAYHVLGPERYLDSQVAFTAIPSGDSIALADANGCAIELTYAGEQISAQDNGKCARDLVSFDGTYDRQ